MGHFSATNPFGSSGGMNVCSLPNCTVAEEAHAQLTRQSAIIAAQAEVIEALEKVNDNIRNPRRDAGYSLQQAEAGLVAARAKLDEVQNAQ